MASHDLGHLLGNPTPTHSPVLRSRCWDTDSKEMQFSLPRPNNPLMRHPFLTEWPACAPRAWRPGRSLPASSVRALKLPSSTDKYASAVLYAEVKMGGGGGQGRGSSEDPVAGSACWSRLIPVTAWHPGPCFWHLADGTAEPPTVRLRDAEMRWAHLRRKGARPAPASAAEPARNGTDTAATGSRNTDSSRESGGDPWPGSFACKDHCGWQTTRCGLGFGHIVPTLYCLPRLHCSSCDPSGVRYVDNPAVLPG